MCVCVTWMSCPVLSQRLMYDTTMVMFAVCREMCQLAERENALIFLDECHATGFLGDSGRSVSQTSDITGIIILHLDYTVVWYNSIQWTPTNLATPVKVS